MLQETEKSVAIMNAQENHERGASSAECRQRLFAVLKIAASCKSNFHAYRRSRTFSLDTVIL